MVSLISMPEKNGILKYSVIYTTVAACVGYSGNPEEEDKLNSGRESRKPVQNG